ncbi:hypothetical protein RFI_03094 [Reticulomyxa filosa]|uniref:HEAT repeat domain-containing protein n=1 Tax=Reticulomyxa filosa TaxID=46433 RepID=X6P656_RETFI|nr:hypothetical protein RFI_03094 [Reticulomyxa filosa]|eukprot:ETO34000.1 hypothetical protein RFI_03094 [Reticulomyxa filosa]
MRKNWENAINTLIDGLKNKNEAVRYSCAKSLGVTSMILTYKQLERVFNALTYEQEKNYFYSYKIALEEISAKLNDKQLYLLVIHLDALLKISEDMWKRATICGLKENIQMKNENTLMSQENSDNPIWKTTNDINIQLLAFGLMTFNPCIQLSCDDDNTNFDALNELIRYCDKQAIEWKFSTHQSKWNNSNIDRDIQYPYLNNEIE